MIHDIDSEFWRTKISPLRLPKRVRCCPVVAPDFIAVKRRFPGLIRDGATIKDASKNKNCHAHTFRQKKWFGPDASWWENSPKTNHVSVWLRNLRQWGYKRTTKTKAVKSTREVVVLYTIKGYVLHSAFRQWKDRLTSKLGAGPIITNHRADSVAGEINGRPTHWLVRRAIA